MGDWLHNLPILWMALVIFGFTYLVAATIYLIVMTVDAEISLHDTSPYGEVAETRLKRPFAEDLSRVWLSLLLLQKVLHHQHLRVRPREWDEGPGNDPSLQFRFSRNRSP